MSTENLFESQKKRCKKKIQFSITEKKNPKIKYSDFQLFQMVKRKTKLKKEILLTNKIFIYFSFSQYKKNKDCVLTQTTQNEKLKRNKKKNIK